MMPSAFSGFLEYGGPPGCACPAGQSLFSPDLGYPILVIGPGSHYTYALVLVPIGATGNSEVWLRFSMAAKWLALSPSLFLSPVQTHSGKCFRQILSRFSATWETSVVGSLLPLPDLCSLKFMWLCPRLGSSCSLKTWLQDCWGRSCALMCMSCSARTSAVANW